MRKMATIRMIDALNPIKGADAIECATVGGWKVVVKKGEFTVGDLAVYCEIDSWIPHELAPFLSKGNFPRVFNEVKGERLRTVKLRGQLSQGLLLPVTQFDETRCMLPQVQVELGDFTFGPKMVYLDEDVSEILGIQKWEMPMNAQLAGMAKGNFPSVIPKTDQERIQNIKQEITGAAVAGLQFEVTEKLEGSSMTCYLIEGVFGVCSRNLDLKETEGNTFWQVARRERIEEKMRLVVGDDFAIQGELIGPGIQGNIYNLTQPEFRVFDVYGITTGSYLFPQKRRELIRNLGLHHVPVLHIKDLGVGSVEEILQWAEGKSVVGDINGPEREGIVFKEVNGGMTFKAISNKYLLGEK